MNKKLLIGLGIVAALTAVIAIGVAHKMKKNRRLKLDAEELDAIEDQKENSDD